MKKIFFISDSTGITAETLGRSLLTQFPQFEFEQTTIPYVNNIAKAQEVQEQINQTCREQQAHVLVFSSLANLELRNIIFESDATVLDLFAIFVPILEEQLNTKHSQRMGQLHKIKNLETYETRVLAIEYALNTDDGIGINQYQKADIILIGVSRSGKTPTCLYLALKFGLFAANYPLTEEDLSEKTLPKQLIPYQNKLFGLTINAQRLHEIRQKRKPDSNYATIGQCKKELSVVEKIFAAEQIPYLDSTEYSIEELATKIMVAKNIKRFDRTQTKINY